VAERRQRLSRARTIADEKGLSVDIVRYDVATGDRTVKVSAEKLTPAGAPKPLASKSFQ
jgi:hypothetical protein